MSRDLPKLGYKGVESCELTFDDCRVPASAILGGEPGKGFAQMMKGLETGRIQVASRALGVATAALEDALALCAGAGELRPADLETPGGRPLPGRHGHQADRRPPAHAVRRGPLRRGRARRHGGRAWPSCSPPRSRWRSRSTPSAIHGGYGYSTEFDVERYFRDAPLMIVGEGTNEIQRNVIAGQLVARGGI